MRFLRTSERALFCIHARALLSPTLSFVEFQNSLQTRCFQLQDTEWIRKKGREEISPYFERIPKNPNERELEPELIYKTTIAAFKTLNSISLEKRQWWHMHTGATGRHTKKYSLSMTVPSKYIYALYFGVILFYILYVSVYTFSFTFLESRNVGGGRTGLKFLCTIRKTHKNIYRKVHGMHVFWLVGCFLFILESFHAQSLSLSLAPTVFLPISFNVPMCSSSFSSLTHFVIVIVVVGRHQSNDEILFFSSSTKSL